MPAPLPGSQPLDLGGNEIHERGEFDLERYDLSVIDANLPTVKRPEVQAVQHYSVQGRLLRCRHLL